MKIDLQTLYYGGDLKSHTIELPDDGIICETSYENLGRDDVTGYIYVTSNTEGHKEIINNLNHIKAYPTFTPEQIILFIDSSKITSADIYLSSLEELNAYMKFDYWIKMVTPPNYSIDYLFNNLNSLKLYTNSYERIIRFTGSGSTVEALAIGNDDWLHEGKKVDLICKSNKNIDIFDTLSWTKTQPIWVPKEELNQVVENRIQEILQYG
jgi:hypothetical protein